MVTQGTNEGGSSMNRNRGGNGQRYGSSSKPVRGTRDGGKAEGRRSDQRERGPRNFRPDGNGGSNIGRYGRNEGNHSAKPYDKNRGYHSTSKFSGKDDEEEDNGRRSKPSRPKEGKSGVTIPDKNKTMLRLEKEQKSIKKKQSKKKESNRPQPRVKRANNVNYTKNYENGDYDDYESYYDL